MTDKRMDADRDGNLGDTPPPFIPNFEEKAEVIKLETDQDTAAEFGGADSEAIIQN